METPLQIKAYDHVKVAIDDLKKFKTTLKVFGFQEIASRPAHLENPESVWGSGEAFFVLYPKDHPLSKKHYDLHGDTIFDLSFQLPESGNDIFVIDGVGEMRHTITPAPSFDQVSTERGILKFDHNTLNVDMGKLEPTVCEYLSKFALERGQFFNIHTKQTGLNSWVTRTSNFGVQIPFNEATEPQSQVQEYVQIHKGPGVQHIALLTDNIIGVLDTVQQDSQSNFKFLDIPDTYYELAKNRVKIREDLKDLERLRILVDQDDQGGYLLQIFTQNLFGGFFFEVIQREGNVGFGEGNFQALFESIELDQKRRGVLA